MNDNHTDFDELAANAEAMLEDMTPDERCYELALTVEPNTNEGWMTYERRVHKLSRTEFMIEAQARQGAMRKIIAAKPPCNQLLMQIAAERLGNCPSDAELRKDAEFRSLRHDDGGDYGEAVSWSNIARDGRHGRGGEL